MPRWEDLHVVTTNVVKPAYWKDEADIAHAAELQQVHIQAILEQNEKIERLEKEILTLKEGALNLCRLLDSSYVRNRGLCSERDAAKKALKEKHNG